MSRMAVLFLAFVIPTITSAAGDVWPSAAAKPGAKLVVMDVDGRTHTGRLLEWAAGGLAIQTQSGRAEIARERVALIRAPGPLGNMQTVFAPWMNLAQVPSGHPVRVIRTMGLPVSGTSFGIMEDGVQLTRGRKIVFIRKDEIRKVRIQVMGKTGIGKKVGAATGAATGFVAAMFLLAAALQTGNVGGDFSELGETLDFFEAGGGKAGGALDRLFDQYQTIYVSPRK